MTDPQPPAQLGTFSPDEVTFLVTDLTDRIEESSLEARDQHLRDGGHYSELLPVEYEPTAEYRAMFEVALERNAAVVARAVAVAGERILALRSEPFVLVSLARAGTPVGILLRRYLRDHRDVEVADCTVSIIRGRGIDRVAIAWIRRQHPGATLQFVDGWTGKGAIQRELSRECAALGLDDRMAVVADPGWCAALPGTRHDLLVPSACLNATISGLVSRTVLRRDLVPPGAFHGAKVYEHLRPVDVSNRFVDVVAAAIDHQVVADAAEEAARPLEAPTWSGWAAVDRIGREFGIDDPNRIKPGIGEARAVLLRRTPERLLVREEQNADLDHLVQLARERSVTVQRYDDMPFSACGLVRP